MSRVNVYKGCVCIALIVEMLSLGARLTRGAENALHVEPDPSTRYGPFGMFDQRSTYGKYWFPEPLRADEADVDNEIRLDYFHAERAGRQFDSGRLELEKSFGLLTVEIAPGYESDRIRAFNRITGHYELNQQAGFTNLELGARYPFYEYVSADGFFDTSLVLGLEVSPPVLSEISRDVEFVPKVFNLTRVGEHLSVQLGLGDSVLVGPQDRGLSTLEYDAVFGYELTERDLPLPGVLSTVPIVEFDGECTLNHAEAGTNQLFATAGFRFNLDSIPGLPAQPRLGVGYTIPIDKGARNEFRWGVVASVIFEY